MSRYIDADKLLSSFKKSYLAACKWEEEAKDEETKTRANAAVATFTECYLRTKDMPTADVEEVRHGKDLYYTVYDTHCEFKCSVCNAWIAIVEGGTLDAARDFNYCPACGAKMDKEEEE